MRPRIFDGVGMLAGGSSHADDIRILCTIARTPFHAFPARWRANAAPDRWDRGAFVSYHTRLPSSVAVLLQICDSRLIISFTPRSPFFSFIRVSHIQVGTCVYVLTLCKNLSNKYMRSFKFCRTYLQVSNFIFYCYFV